MRFARLLFIWMLIISYNSPAQEKVDSILKRIAKQSADTNLVNSYLDLIDIVYVNDLDTSIYYAKKALDVSKQIKWDQGIGESYGWMAYLYDNRGEVAKAFKYEKLALDYRRKVGDINQIAASLNNLGYMYEHQGDVTEAMKMYKECLSLMEKEENLMALGVITNNIGYIYWKGGHYDSAYFYQNRALDHKIKLGDPKMIALGRSSLGRTLMSLGDTLRGLDQLLQAKHTADSINSPSTRSVIYNNLAIYHESRGELQTAHDYAKQSYELAKQINYIGELQEASKLMYRLNKKLGRNSEALRYYEEYVEIRDSIRNSENEKEALRHQMSLEHEKELAEIKAEEARKDALDQAEKDQQSFIIKVSIGGLIILGVLLIFIFNRLQVTRRQKLLIEEQKKEVQEQRDLVATKNEEITASITYAKRLQEAILPPVEEVKEQFPNSFILYKPKDIVAGDFYWMERHENKTYLAVADCTGHGVPGAMVSVVCSNALSKALIEEGITQPAQILDRARELVIDRFARSESNINDGMDISLIAYDESSDVIEWAGANNPLWIIRAGNTVEEIKGDKQPIGRHHQATPFTNQEIAFSKGDSLCLFTDGFADQFGGKDGKKLKYASFKELLLSSNSKDIDDQLESISLYFDQWKGHHEQVDDVCLIKVKL